MKIIKTHEDDLDALGAQEREWCYNGLDCTVTAEVFDVLRAQLDNHTTHIYRFSRDLQAPVLDMRLRGVRVDNRRRNEVIEEYYTLLDTLAAQLEAIVGRGLDFWDFNWRSGRDISEVLYKRLGIPPVKRGGRPTVDRDALEKLGSYFSAKQIVSHLMVMRDLDKKISVLKTEIDPDGRIRTSYNIAGTTTGRLSSSFSEFGTGGNLQNIEEALRSVFVSDQGKKMAYIDAAQGESRVVGGIEWQLFKDGRYLDACETGDLHTSVAKLCWPKLGWCGDAERDRKLAEQPFYRHYDYRFMCKKIGHGSNYRGQPATLATQAKIDVSAIKAFQPVYFSAFPAHAEWHAWTDDQLIRFGHVVTITGRKRWFFGRREDQETQREATAYQGQALADILNAGMINVWKHRDCELLMQIHDAILIQYDEEREDEILPKVLAQLRYPVDIGHGRELVLPYDCKTGWNWGAWDGELNPDGLKSYKGRDGRKRQPEVGILDRVVRRSHKQFRKR